MEWKILHHAALALAEPTRSAEGEVVRWVGVIELGLGPFNTRSSLYASQHSHTLLQ